MIAGVMEPPLTDPEEWAEIINGAFAKLIEPVYRYEGTLARLMGDAILAFFGAPIGHEDDPQRAVRAGLEIVRDIAPYREEVRERWGHRYLGPRRHKQRPGGCGGGRFRPPGGIHRPGRCHQPCGQDGVNGPAGHRTNLVGHPPAGGAVV